MFPSLALFSRTTYRGASGSGAGRSGLTGFRSSPDSKRSNTPSEVLWMKRSQRGLYHGVTMQSGHNVPKSRQKTKRLFQPNVHQKRIFSELLNGFIPLKVTSKALRTIEKKGGLDAYLCDSKDHELGMLGVQLRNELGAVAKGVMDAQKSGSDAISIQPLARPDGREARKAHVLAQRLVDGLA